MAEKPRSEMDTSMNGEKDDWTVRVTTAKLNPKQNTTLSRAGGERK